MRTRQQYVQRTEHEQKNPDVSDRLCPKDYSLPSNHRYSLVPQSN